MQQQFTFAQSRRFRLRTKSVRYFRNGEERGFYRGDARFRVQFSGTGMICRFVCGSAG